MFSFQNNQCLSPQKFAFKTVKVCFLTSLFTRKSWLSPPVRKYCPGCLGGNFIVIIIVRSTTMVMIVAKMMHADNNDDDSDDSPMGEPAAGWPQRGVPRPPWCSCKHHGRSELMLLRLSWSIVSWLISSFLPWPWSSWWKRWYDMIHWTCLPCVLFFRALCVSFSLMRMTILMSLFKKYMALVWSLVVVFETYKQIFLALSN